MASRTRELLSRPRVQLTLLLGSSVALHAWHLAYALTDPYLQHRVVDEVFFHAWGSDIAALVPAFAMHALASGRGALEPL